MCTLRAVHIEIAHSLDTDSFLCCLQRFMNRRGKPEKIYSDNGTNFTSGEKELKQCIIEWNTKKISKSRAQQHIEWHFNPPAASHMGGVWERLIRSTKNILRKILHQQIVNDKVLITVMTEAERVMNDRPLIKASSDSKDNHVITPNSLLMMKQAVPGPIHTDVNVDYTRRRWRQSQHISNVFWRKWILQYLPCLQSRQKWCAVKENLKVNDVVLIVDEIVQRGSWPLGRITATRPDRNGHVRTVEVMSQGSVKCRPISKIVLLERSDNVNHII